MKKVFVLAVAMLMLTGIAVNAQKIKLESGSLGFLSGQEALMVSYDYSDVSVNFWLRASFLWLLIRH